MELDLASLGYLWHSNYTKALDNVIINEVGEKISPSLLLLLFPIKRTAEAGMSIKENSLSKQTTHGFTHSSQ